MTTSKSATKIWELKIWHNWLKLRDYQQRIACCGDCSNLTIVAGINQIKVLVRTKKQKKGGAQNPKKAKERGAQVLLVRQVLDRAVLQTLEAGSISAL